MAVVPMMSVMSVMPVMPVVPVVAVVAARVGDLPTGRYVITDFSRHLGGFDFERSGRYAL
ncbi:uncharacterized protein PG998_005049 [Apiospora kogelbergensis]|uniref:Uncharacterized protein n=1 Tax=Apiospora kogelbergensis TaxID=1337665 RepID=A0AAW0Q9G9_9PEZI